VSHVPTLKTPSFLHQLVALINRQSVDVHGIQITFLLEEVILSLWGLLLPGVSPSLFNCSIHLIELVVKSCRPFIPAVIRLVVDVHVYLNIFQELFEVISVSVESFRFEVKFLSSVDGLSHGECVSNRLIMALYSGDEVFDG
jgi:hypothetical protein